MEGDQRAAITEYLLGLGGAARRHPRQHMGLPLAHGGQKRDAGEVAVTPHEHAWLYRAQHRGSQALFTDATGSQDGIDDGMGPGLGQGEAAHLGKGTGTLAAGQPPEMQPIGRGVSHLIQRALDGHEPESEAESAFGHRASHGPTLVAKEQAQDRDT